MARYLDEHGNEIDPADLDDYEVPGGDGDPVDVDDFGFDLPDVDDVPDQPVEHAEVSRPTPTGTDDPLIDFAVDDAPDDPVTPTPSTADATAFAVPAEVGEVASPEMAAPTLNRKSKLLLVGGALVAVVVIGVGVVFALNGVGSQNTVDDVKAGAASKYAAASSSVVAKSSEVRGDAAAVAIDTCRAGKLSGPGGLGDAMAKGSEAPKLRLDVISATPLPGPFIAASGPNADGVSGKVSMLQLTRTGWGVYTTMPLTKAERKQEVTRPGYHKADVTVTEDQIKATGDRVWAGGDQGGAGSCEPGEPGIYAATGKVPADAAGLVDGRADVTAIQGIAGRSDAAVAVMGNSVVLVRLAEAAPEGGDASSSSSSSSAVPSR